MTLKRKVESLDSVEEAYRPLYTERTEKGAAIFVLSEIEDWDAPEKLRSARTEAGGLRVENNKFKAQLAAFEGVDVEVAANAIVELQAAKDEIEALKAGKGNDAKAIEKAVESRLKAATNMLENKIKKLEGDYTKVQDENKQLLASAQTRAVDDAALSAFRELKVEADVFSLKGDDPDDLPDGLLWARGRFKVGEDGKVIDKNGLTPKDVLASMRDAGQRGHWFGETGGTGSRSAGNHERAGANPWMPGALWDPTKQCEIQSKDPQRAASLATAAGCPDVDAAFHPKDGGMREFSRY